MRGGAVNNVPRIAVTMGDPSGVGPEVCAKAFASSKMAEVAQPVYYGSLRVLLEACRIVEANARRVENGVEIEGNFIEVVEPESLKLTGITPGKLSEEGARLMMWAVKRAVEDALEGRVEAVVTSPINKEGIRLAGLDYPGHTEFIRDLTGAERVVMMLAGESLKVALVTIHVALKKALQLITAEKVLETIEVVHRDFVSRLGVEKPRIAVAGVNPHAGEGGLFGDEEQNHVIPAVEAARAAGIDASGPYPPDTVFYRAYRGEFDVVIAQYHDQGLIPLKLIHFDTGVNVSLGLPIVRTSVDHGTAYDIAWKGVASESSLLAAIRMAVAMSGRR